MAFIPNQQINTGSFVPTTEEWDVAQLYQLDIKSQEFKELLVRLYRNVNTIALSLNTRNAGFYFPQEFVDGCVWFNRTSTNPLDRRYEFRKVIDFGALPNTGIKSVAHGITVTSTLNWTQVKATATDTTGLFGIELPYASPVLANNIELYVDSTNVNVITGSNRTNFNICTVVLEYLKS